METYLFRCGADMDPTAIRAVDPGARFVARARLPGGVPSPLVPSPDDEVAEVWGLLLRPGGVPAPAEARATEVLTDDGRPFRAVVATAATDVADPRAVVAAARYWELPPAYVVRLPGLLDAPDGEA